MVRLRADGYSFPNKLLIEGISRGALVAGLTDAHDALVAGIVEGPKRGWFLQRESDPPKRQPRTDFPQQPRRLGAILSASCGTGVGAVAVLLLAVTNSTTSLRGQRPRRRASRPSDPARKALRSRQKYPFSKIQNPKGETTPCNTALQAMRACAA